MKTDNLDIIIPISNDIDWPEKEETVRDIIEQYKNYGFTRFALASPCGGWRSIGYPPEEFYIENAKTFKWIKEQLEPYGIECGWWITLTLKSGKTEGFQSIIKADGSAHPFSNCPFGDAFKNRFAKDVAKFCEIAKPAFVITEDDLSVNAAGGCYCDKHISEFAKRYNINMTREDLVKTLSKTTPEAIEIIKKWRELTKASLVEFADAIRTEVDKLSPEIPIGYMQAGLVDCDGNGDCTYDISKAFAGDRHIPFSRIYGAEYGGIKARNIPLTLYHLLYSKQHMKGEFNNYLEADTFPHTRFFTASCQMNATMSAAFSFGFVGATFQTQQLLDNANEETAYGYAFKKERDRFNVISKIAKRSNLKGVTLEYDPLYNTIEKSVHTVDPLWTKVISRFGIPYTTEQSDIVFWDLRQAKYSDDATIKKALSGNLFLDGDAAKCLCERGYGEYLGVSIGEDIATQNPKASYDLGAREIILDKFKGKLKGTHMTSAWMFCPTAGKRNMYRINIEDQNCETITDLYSYDKKHLTTAMTRFENKLGGKVVVMGLALDYNQSQSLFNYRRKYLLLELIKWCGCNYVLVEDAPEVYIIENAAKQGEEDFREMLTLINMCEDSLNSVSLYLPESLRENNGIYILDKNAEWQKADYTIKEDGVIINHNLNYCDAMYLLIK